MYCVLLCYAVVWCGVRVGVSSFAVCGPNTHRVQPAGPLRGLHLGLPHRLMEACCGQAAGNYRIVLTGQLFLHVNPLATNVGKLTVTPHATTTPKPCPTWAELAGVAREGTRGCGVVWYGVVWCGVVWCAEGAVTKRQKAGMSTHGYR